MPKNTKQETSTTEDENSKMEDTSVMDDDVNGSLDGSVKMEEEKVDIEELQAKSPWSLGQLVWARMGSYPYWPSIVTLDPTTKSFVMLRHRG